jgi:hypothetical protein
MAGSNDDGVFIRLLPPIFMGLVSAVMWMYTARIDKLDTQMERLSEKVEEAVQQKMMRKSLDSRLEKLMDNLEMHLEITRQLYGRMPLNRKTDSQFTLEAPKKDG